MLATVRIALVADNPARNCHRAYIIEAGTDLFDHWTVTTRYGRHGRPGHTSLQTFDSPSAAQDHIHHLLSRRATAPTRLGTAYRLTEFTSPEGQPATAWFPDPLRRRFPG